MMNRLFATTPDIENCIILLIIGVLFILGLKKKARSRIGGKFLCIDLNMSKAMKGIACIFILLGHYGQRKSSLIPEAGLISKAVWQTTANIGLLWFMFFSGYGLSLKNMATSEIFGKWWNRIKKVYLPLLFTSIITTVIYALLPIKFNATTAKTLWISDAIVAIHNGDIRGWLPGMFGWLDWYVFCIMIFYTLFYLSYYIMKKMHWNQTLVLSVMMVGYFVWAYSFFGPSSAHWYRFIWVFLLGHIIARQQSEDKSFMILMLLPFIGLILLESKEMIADYWLGLYGLLIIAILNRYYQVKKGSVILFLGNISYFYYLCHVRIGYQLMTYMGINDLIFWTAFTVGIAWILKSTYNILPGIKNM